MRCTIFRFLDIFLFATAVSSEKILKHLKSRGHWEVHLHLQVEGEMMSEGECSEGVYHTLTSGLLASPVFLMQRLGPGWGVMVGIPKGG